MEIRRGDIVQSLNGRDKGRPLYVLDVDGAYLLLIDGKSRRAELPKRKKTKHCLFLVRDTSRVSEKIRKGERLGNSEVRKSLAAFLAGETSQTGGGL